MWCRERWRAWSTTTTADAITHNTTILPVSFPLCIFVSGDGDYVLVFLRWMGPTSRTISWWPIASPFNIIDLYLFIFFVCANCRIYLSLAPPNIDTSINCSSSNDVSIIRCWNYQLYYFNHIVTPPKYWSLIFFFKLLILIYLLSLLSIDLSII